MSQYQANTGVQEHKPTMVEKVKAKAEGLVEKVTGHGQTHTGTHTGGTNVTTGTPGGAGYPRPQQPGHAEPQQYAATNPGYEAAQHGQRPRKTIVDKVKDAVMPGHTGTHQTGTGTHQTGTVTAAPGTAHISTTDKIKNMLPGHHHHTTTTGTVGTGTTGTAGTGTTGTAGTGTTGPVYDH